ncbi:FraH-like protein [Crocosphaera subtropica ATCC 51142]|uniref:FraH-like protein n=1 Tax=Crocosphaera subtropica (strain ATCC 51142 / BH68) TaxID=43989 RepID=B1WWG2_CROS5|nr:FHA domain-containing protein [Crocosphaera subtropica]ACB54090.1 FraH-like protein [Crocosphaera subtropica ATCC 51142]
MITCPNCEHQNPDGAIQCEACFTPLPQLVNCGNCGQPLLSNATFCGECGAANPFEGSTEAEAEPSPPPPPVTPPPPPIGNLPEASPTPPPPPTKPPASAPTQLQTQTASLLHLQTDTTLELPQGLDIIHVGKPNEQIPPDLDVSGLPNSDVVSRIHADIRNEAGIFYIEDVGSSNGTYINYNALPPGNRHRLRPGDRISLGKGDLVTFVFQLS